MTKRFDIAFLVTGLIVQIIVYWLAPTHWLSLVSGLLGITSFFVRKAISGRLPSDSVRFSRTAGFAGWSVSMPDS